MQHVSISSSQTFSFHRSFGPSANPLHANPAKRQLSCSGVHWGQIPLGILTQ